MENSQVLVVLNNISEWERKWSLVSISLNIDSSLLLIFAPDSCKSGTESPP